MNTLKGCATLALLLGVLSFAHPSDAAPITYNLVTVAGDCATPPLGCINDWSGLVFSGQFTLDASVPTFTAFSFNSHISDTNFTWLGPVFPDPVPGDSLTPSFSLSSSPGGTSMRFTETLTVQNVVEDQWDLAVSFSSPLSAFDGSTFTGGSVSRLGPPIRNPLVSGHADVVPEPGSLFLLGTGIASLGAWRRRRKAVGP